MTLSSQATYGQEALDLLAPQSGERILMLGCGDGVLIEQLAKRGVEVVGVDTAKERVAVAQELVVDARVMDAYQMTFDHDFDAVFSYGFLHWMLDPQAVLAGVKRALKPNGRFVAEFGGHGNTAAICTALIAALQFRGISTYGRYPWYFPTPDEYRHVLETVGFKVKSIALEPAPKILPPGMERWLTQFAKPFLHGLDEDLRFTIIDNALLTLGYTLHDGYNNWTADYVYLRVSAYL
ncbi:class I SAM-dependent methyltransferase [Halomonas llamarensis]|uniref:Class I SAM-dependent methyltransferase n=1 Tax=Halomonas llamarensis TaxID=2945104 RepID=A0ABT0STA5_9GAMM|nr:class I SAM-dependent methyltransferase [Halomonas llamarensis]